MRCDCGTVTLRPGEFAHYADGVKHRELECEASS